MKRKAALHNLGCKVNAYETEAMQKILEEAGYEIVPFAPGADVYVINTCTVTNIADRKSRQMLHRARKMNPDAIVVAAGCYVQTDAEQIEKDPAVDLIIGNNQKGQLADRLEHFFADRMATGAVPDIGHEVEYESLWLDGERSRTRASLKVQDGCNQFCSYCVIPYARGRIRSERTEAVVREARRLAAGGCREIVLTGIHLSSYGKDRPQDQEDLLGLIRAVHAVDGVRRIRLGSLEPGIITEEFASALSVLPRVCPHFHLSLQSGCTATLRRMNRRYTAEEYRKRVEILRRYFADPALTTDVIVGFPQETEEEFEESRAFVEEMHFFETHIFPYSRREGTRAAAMPGQIPEAVKKERSQILISLGERHTEEYMRRQAGSEKEVLFEERQMIGGRTFWVGHTAEYLKVAAPSEGELGNALRMVRLDAATEHRLIFGKLCTE